MLDIHPAPHAANSWRDFFVHIATIVLGLLIAVGLEQTAEYIHHRHQRRELSESVAADRPSSMSALAIWHQLEVANGFTRVRRYSLIVAENPVFRAIR